MIDRSLSYGRNNIAAFLQAVAPFDTLVDLGAGTGVDLELASRICPDSLRYAVETYPPYIEMLKTHHHVLDLNLERDPLPLADESVDVILSNQVLEHVKEIFWIMHEATRTLRVGGHMILGVPNLASLHNRLLLLVGMQPTVIQNHSAHLRGYTRHDLLRLFQMIFPGGFDLIDFRGANFYPLPGAVARPLANLWPNAAWSIFFLLRKLRPYNNEFILHPIRKQLETNFYVANARDLLSGTSTG